ncbi:glutamine amidotransferase-related protein [Candidatus Tremblaya princeps]|uniref:glutamine amidotransferase-related protein n=1 Tax=Tremblaya princeps TaxID=189385 RepID=UPI000946753F
MRPCGCSAACGHRSSTAHSRMLQRAIRTALCSFAVHCSHEGMAVRHASLPTQCVQFHPESEFTQYRGAIFANMVSQALVST